MLYQRAVIITALPVEYKAARAHLCNFREEVHKGTVYEIGEFNSEDCHWEVALVETGAGGSTAALEAERVISYFQPCVLFFMGVGGGVKDVMVGDVVAASKIYGYESGKATTVFLPRPDVGNSSHAMQQRARAVARAGSWVRRISHADNGIDPRAFVGAIAAGEKVIASAASELYRFLVEHYSDALAVDMEGHGFLKAGHANSGVLSLVVRGISDTLTNKSDSNDGDRQVVASRNASAFLFEVLAGVRIDRRATQPQRDLSGIDLRKRSSPPNNAPGLPALFLGRDRDIEKIKQLISIQRLPIVALQGMPGIGKTALAAALASDSDIKSMLPGGVLWTSLGQDADVMSVIVDWSAALGDHQILRTTSLKDACGKLTETLRDRHMLLIVDDVWDVEQVAPFIVASGNSNVLILTTRVPSALDDLSIDRQSVYRLKPLAQDAAMRLLGLLAPLVMQNYPNECAQLIRTIESLPLAILVAGKLLNSESQMGWSVVELLDELQVSTRLLQEKAPASQINLDTKSIPTVSALFQRSTDRLTPDVRRFFAFLSPLKPAPDTFGIDALRFLWKLEDPKPVIRALVGHGLIEPVGGRFQIHGLLLQHAQTILNRGVNAGG